MHARRSASLRHRVRAAGLTIAAVLLLAYPADWLIWRGRMLMGSGMGTELVTQTTAATLKGNHFEVYSQQTTSVNCSRPFFQKPVQGPAGGCTETRRS